MKVDKGVVLTAVAVVATAASMICGFLANRYENNKAASILPDYSNIKEIVVKKES